MPGVKLSADQLLENERTNCAPATRRHNTAALAAVAAARLARVHGWHASPHAGNGTPRQVAAARLDGQRTPRTAVGP